MLTENIENVYKNIINSIKKMKGYSKRTSIAGFIKDTKISINKATTIFNHSYRYIKKGLNELELGKEIKLDFETRGRKPIEKKLPDLADDIKNIVQDWSQTDPKFKTEKRYVKLTIKEIRNRLIQTGKYDDASLPKKSFLSTFINKIGFKLRKVQKSKPLKKVLETDEIFDNINEIKNKYKNEPNTVMISIDAKDSISIGDFSRGGYNRIDIKACDHDFKTNNTLIPFGILDLCSNKPTIYNTTSKVTADFIVDCLIEWWKQSEYKDNKKRIVIFSDNGPECSSRRTRYMHRLLLFADMFDIEIVLAYYPPYHSKYNPIERIWARLENIWKGDLLNSVEKCIKYMDNMTWKGVNASAYLIEKEYKTGIKESKHTIDFIEQYLTRKKGIEKYAITILDCNA